MTPTDSQAERVKAQKNLATNRKARHEYFIQDKFEAGLARYEFAALLPEGTERAALLEAAVTNFEDAEAKRYLAKAHALQKRIDA